MPRKPKPDPEPMSTEPTVPDEALGPDVTEVEDGGGGGMHYDKPAPQADPGIPLGRRPHPLPRGARLPNIPCFDYDPKSKKPKLKNGEEIIAEREYAYGAVYVTNHGRKIFACSLEDYEEHVGPLTPNAEIFAKMYPHAAK
jgi:hypothetical protein